MQVESIPLFIQIAETVKTRIFNHKYEPGDYIPSAKEFENEFNVSNITIRKAMELLAREGYIVPRRGMRAQVSKPGNEIAGIEITGNFRTWINTATGQKFGITAETIDRQVIACPKSIREILVLDPDEKIEQIKRVRKLRENSISYFVNYGPSRLLTQLSSREIERRTFLETYQDVCKIKLNFMEQRVQATIADIDLAGILQVNFGFPLFFVQNIYYSEKDIPRILTHMYYRSDRYFYTAKRSL